ncbi:TPA: DUF551 domain-containing protein [Klebsiella pneumoniae]|nr:DUF551 domain-containing protein [Klebsiella pneumoniae]MCD5634146.1 DUF551 domain-containing protein [Klebsiella pneumoniae]MCD5644580.1 DUF551 domain-containing protein [Klebsiella pneumoniae]MCD5661621.1 DUF551 domain-containing protein [Klebsiella pneumoniae]MCD5702764.1 DUF551 domain-containing protein [Klebsiella pneumoniae]MCD5717878.1 DUF551 domain-containing protein [Klebsiella pneumoniae]
MTKSTITRERLQELAEGQSGFNLRTATHEESQELARMALAAMDSSESVELPLDYLQGHKDGLEWAARLAEANHPETGDWLYDDPIELAKAIRKGPDMPPVQPAPVVPDDVLKALQKVARIRLDMDGFDGDRRGIADCLCDAEEALIEVVNRRAAMFNHPEQHLDMVDHSGDVNEKGGDGNSPVIPDGWTCNDKANAALMMLDRIETVDPVDDDRIDGIKRIVRELAAAPHDTPALNSIQSVDTVADRWIPVSERMPESNGVYFGWDGKRVLEVNCFFGGFSANQFIHGEITHWMPLPAAPQEVNHG